MTLLGGSGTFLGPVIGAGHRRHAAGISLRSGGRLGFGHHRGDLRGMRDDFPARLRGRNSAAFCAAYAELAGRCVPLSKVLPHQQPSAAWSEPN